MPKPKAIFDNSEEPRPRKRSAESELRALQPFAWDKLKEAQPVGSALQNGDAAGSKRMRKATALFDPMADSHEGQFTAKPAAKPKPKPAPRPAPKAKPASSARKPLGENLPAPPAPGSALPPTAPPNADNGAPAAPEGTGKDGRSLEERAKRHQSKKIIVTYVPREHRHFFRAHPKGVGVVCLRKGGLPAGTFIETYCGAIYTPWRWFEKQDAVKKADPNMDLPDFYNIVLERPGRDPRGFDVLYVDAADAGNYTSRLSHSCGANVATPVMAVDGSLRIVMHTMHDIAEGEEMCWDYSCVTESEREYRAAVCLCGSKKCRGSFLYYSNSSTFSEMLNERHQFLARNAMVFLACKDQALTDQDRERLTRHGFQHAARSAAEATSTTFPPPKCRAGDGEIPWMARWAAYVLQFIDVERERLPELLKLKTKPLLDRRGKRIGDAAAPAAGSAAAAGGASAPSDQPMAAAPAPVEEIVCVECGRGDDEDSMLLCDGCDRAYHKYCLKPKLDVIPDGSWFCPACMSKEGGPVKREGPAMMYTQESAEAEAVGVTGKRLQDLSVTLNKLKYFARKHALVLQNRERPAREAYDPPLHVLTDEEVANHLWNGRDSIAMQCAHACNAIGARTRKPVPVLAELLGAKAPNADDARAKLVEMSRLVRTAGCLAPNAEAVADLLVLYGHTTHWFTPHCAAQCGVVSPPVDRTGQRTLEGIKETPMDEAEEAEAASTGGLRSRGKLDDKKRYGTHYLWGQSASWFKQTIYDPTASLSADRRGCLSLPDPDSAKPYTSKGPQSRHTLLASNLYQNVSLGWSTSCPWSFKNRDKVYGSPMHDDYVRWVQRFGADPKAEPTLAEEDGAVMPKVLRELWSWDNKMTKGAGGASKRTGAST